MVSNKIKRRNRKIGLISTFCDSDEKINLLKETIIILKNKGMDVMCLSPNFINLPKEIVELSDFIFYTKENPILEWPEKSMTLWKRIFTDKGEVRIHHFYPDYGWAALYQFKKLSEIALTFDYDMYCWFVYDSDIDDIILEEIDNNEINIIHPRIAGDNISHRGTFHFTPMDKKITKILSDDITKERYLGVNVAEEIYNDWIDLGYLKVKSHPIKDKMGAIDLNGNSFHNLVNGKIKDFKLFVEKTEYKIRIVVFDILINIPIIIGINGKDYKYNLKVNENLLLEFEENCLDIVNLNIKVNGINYDFSEEYSILTRKMIIVGDGDN
jgi:hypothetical protein